MHLEKLPLLAFHGGWPDDTRRLLEQLLPLLAGQGLKVALVHGEGQAECANRFASAPGQGPRRRATVGGRLEVGELAALCREYDLILVVGQVEGVLTRVFLLGPEAGAAPPAANPWSLVVPWQADRLTILLAFLASWLPKQWQQTPLYGCVLIGGQSRRMGRPKHLIRQEGRTWLERTVSALQAVAEQVVVVGAGELPSSDFFRLPDVPGVVGPVAGLAAAMRWQPWASWLLVACDLPDLKAAALEWLVAARRPGVWAVIPQVDRDYLEPLLAYYDFRVQGAMEVLVQRGEPRIGLLAAAEKVAVLTPPPALQGSWRNVNYDYELD